MAIESESTLLISKAIVPNYEPGIISDSQVLTIVMGNMVSLINVHIPIFKVPISLRDLVPG